MSDNNFTSGYPTFPNTLFLCTVEKSTKKLEKTLYFLISQIKAQSQMKFGRKLVSFIR